MLSLAIFLPLAAALVLLALPAGARTAVRGVALAAAAATLALCLVLWLRFEPGTGYQLVERLPWIESVGVSYAVGLDGMSLPLVLLTAVLFLAALVFSWPEEQRVREYYAWFLFLETACLGVFAAMDLFLFYVFWDLTLVGMYFIIAIWGHEGAKKAALKFFLYTFVGSLALLLGVIGLYLAADPRTTDMVAITAQRPLAGGGWLSALCFFGILAGLAVKTPVVPVHTWLPPAHGEAPAAGSAILAGVLLKMGTYGLFRILLPMLPETAARFAGWLIALGVVSVIYGALVALAQRDLKYLVAYTSVNHMGYVVLAAGAVAVAGAGTVAGKTLAVDGAVLQMVSHGLITGALFLFTGVVWRRAWTFELDAFGGLAKVAPVLAASFSLAAFASLGLPGLSGFVAEFQIFVGVFDVYPLAAAAALAGVVVTAALFLWTIQRLFLGELPERWAGMRDLARHEKLAIFPLLALVVAIGVAPFWVLEVITGFGRALVEGLTSPL